MIQLISKEIEQTGTPEKNGERSVTVLRSSLRLSQQSFHSEGLEDLKTLFASLAGQSQSNGHHISPSVFKRRHDQKFTFEDFVIAKGSYEKGRKDEIEEFIYQLLDVADNGIVGREVEL